MCSMVSVILRISNAICFSTVVTLSTAGERTYD